MIVPAGYLVKLEKWEKLGLEVVQLGDGDEASWVRPG
jgi:hypothetical protein